MHGVSKVIDERRRAMTSSPKISPHSSKETLEHADAIAQRIRSLGYITRLNIHLSLIGSPMRPEEALAEALDVEQQALDAVRNVAPPFAARRDTEPAGPAGRTKSADREK